MAKQATPPDLKPQARGPVTRAGGKGSGPMPTPTPAKMKAGKGMSHGTKPGKQRTC
jgi:hypothetical protein